MDIHDEKVGVKELSKRRVSFNLNHRYLEAKNPWDTRKSHPIVQNQELKELYIKSCQNHSAIPNEKVLELINTTNLSSKSTNRTDVLNLKDQILTHGSCEALEELFKWVQYRSIDVSSCGLDDVSSSALFDMIEYYEATNELNISDNSNIKTRGWQSCFNMMRRSRELHTFSTRSTPLSDNIVSQLGSALLNSYIYTLKLEHCGLSGRPILNLCGQLKKNSILRELFLANNELNCNDAYHISNILRENLYLQLLDISNNDIQDEGCRYITEALIYQSKNLTSKSPTESTSSFDFGDLTGALNTINNNRNRFSPTPKIDVNVKHSGKKLDIDLNLSSIDSKNTNITSSNSNNNINNNNNNSSSNNNNSILLMCDTNDELLKNQMKTDVEKSVENVSEKQNISMKVEDTTKSDNSVIEPPKPEVLEPILNPKTFVRSISDLEQCDESEEQAIASTKKYTTASLSPVSHDDNSTIHGFLTDQRSPERSFSSESLCSETSIESNDSKSSIKLIEQKFNKNGTLERQSTYQQSTVESEKLPTGLQVLILWNNNLTKKSAEGFVDLLPKTDVLEILNIGQNVLTDQFLTDIKTSIKHNKSVNSLGLQNTNITSNGVKTIADIIQFGGNATLQRIDLRNNEISLCGLNALNDAMKCNKSIIQLDLDDTPVDISVPVFDNVSEYTRVVHTIRAQCTRNENPPGPIEPVLKRPQVSLDRMRANHYNSRKISLTCQSVKVKPVPLKAEKQLLDPNNKKTSARLKSPLPSPTPSPLSSPLHSPSRSSRFQVSKVSETSNKLATNSTNSSPSPSSSSGSPTFFPAKPTNSRFHVTRVEVPKTKKEPSTIKSTTLLNPHIPIKVSVPVQVDMKENEEQPPSSSMPLQNPPIAVTSVVSVPNFVPPAPIIQSSFLNVSNTSILSQSLDSPDPDYEVKKYMDLDSCSSFSSSMDSIDHPIDLNAPASSLESLDVVVKGPPINDPKIEIEVELSNENTVISNSSSSSNEGHTLTPTDMSPKESGKRNRKSSWIQSIGAKHSGSDHGSNTASNYPATLDKLLNLFHNPGSLFQKTSPDSTLSTSPSSNSSISGANSSKSKVAITNKDTGIIARESPISGLLHWAASTLSHKKDDKDATLKSSSSVPNSTSSGVSTILQNISPENSINKSTNSQMIIESLPKSVKKELKENISPENTISCEKMGNLETQSKVLFQVGDLDDDNQTAPAATTEEEYESEDDKLDALVQPEGTHQKNLGQITRDSLSILKQHDSSSDTSTLTSVND